MGGGGFPIYLSGSHLIGGASPYVFEWALINFPPKNVNPVLAVRFVGRHVNVMHTHNRGCLWVQPV